ncbi:cyclin-dependent kinase 2-associated protein 1-like [Aethina tumida]|uniref:cyclin-dependent kinase 2-associated protein 1-like n=1 Tax=Aethina tumida TaxID=116153 RepID=UPI00096ADDE3|nr:cyclin-dependent kinase 2-associated protein 1-like [Aethina tumida]
METVDIQAVESKLSDVTVTAIPMSSKPSVKTEPPQPAPKPVDPSKYVQLLGVIEEMGREVHPTYAGSKSSAERLKRGIVHARILVRECLIETERSARQ